MKGALIIFAFTVFAGFCLWITDKFFGRHLGIYPDTKKTTDESEDKNSDANKDACCGMHDVCEKDFLSPVSAEYEYYDDEELDAFIGRDADSYSPEETEVFRDILLTLRPEDAPGWSKSIQLRGIVLPPEVRDELLMIVSEQRQKNKY